VVLWVRFCPTLGTKNPNMNKKTIINLFVANSSHREVILYFLNNVVMKIIEIQKSIV